MTMYEQLKRCQTDDFLNDLIALAKSMNEDDYNTVVDFLEIAIEVNGRNVEDYNLVWGE